MRGNVIRISSNSPALKSLHKQLWRPVALRGAFHSLGHCVYFVLGFGNASISFVNGNVNVCRSRYISSITLICQIIKPPSTVLLFQRFLDPIASIYRELEVGTSQRYIY